MGIVGVEQAKAYGSAGDLPGLLRAMESTDPDVREEAMQWLGSATYHDDDLALSTAGAVPRLARLVLEGPGHRVDLLRLLAGLARRSDWPDAAQPARRAVADALPPLLPLAHDATMEWASRLGPAAAPLLPFIEPSLTRDGTASAALAVWRITGRTEDTLEPLAREAMRWQRIYDGLTHPVSTLTEMGLLPRFAVEPLRRGAASRRRVVHDFMTGPEPHADDVSRTAVRKLLDTARIVD
ncbi:hypothetical protein ABZY42_01065 [Streptomyces sp. NPDC006622]|uniref:hypothetical protein n=1 Tax=Streptomyces sp. NPDC006622 TaxID=3155459 RepID=UPI0033A2509E